MVHTVPIDSACVHKVDCYSPEISAGTCGISASPKCHGLSSIPTKLNWLVVLNHLEKCESQWEGLSHILWKIKNV